MKAMKSQAIAFLLGFTLTSFALFCIPGIGTKTSRISHSKDQKLASEAQDIQRNDSSVISNGHLNTNSVVVTP